MRQLNRIVCTAAVGIATSALVGCQDAVRVPQGRVNEVPLDIDEAMAVRDWDRSVAYYENPRFVAGPTGFWFETPYEPTQWYYAATDTPLFLGQVLLLPVTLAITPGWTTVQYAGETLEPTFHAMPVLPMVEEGPPPAPEPGPEAPMPEPLDPLAPMEESEDLPRGVEQPLPPPAPPGEMPPPPYEPAPGEPVLPTQPTRGLDPGRERRTPATQPGIAPRETPRVEYVPSSVAPAPTTAPTTAPAARDVNK